MREFTFDLEAGDGIASHWSPFGKFPRQFEVISLQDWQPIHKVPCRASAAVCAVRTPPPTGARYGAARHRNSSRRRHSVAPHLNVRRYVYANIGGTLNFLVDVADNVIPPTPDMVHCLPNKSPWGETGPLCASASPHSLQPKSGMCGAAWSACLTRSEYPPLTLIVRPVIWLAPSGSRNVTTFATSAGTPSLRRG